ncbi:hypothetical protein HZS61_016326 [Fusarium oxysporum f. sp. conglutinans]|uniref:Uncharacterized protein n=1 Tax=Fusarium oxysporum f. sp. conglutinans TaxID=100902 RepID=A0A8H6GKU0_FUSOX|nr:hypothetical protein HZS61_016326 [Fusarium oxysporum f. sp. conglutinans]
MPTATTKRFHLQTLELSSFFLCPVSLPPYRPKPSPFASIPLGQSDSCSSRELKKRDTPQSTSGFIISPFRSFSSADPRYYGPGAFQHCLDSTYLPNTFVPGE